MPLRWPRACASNRQKCSGLSRTARPSRHPPPPALLHSAGAPKRPAGAAPRFSGERRPGSVGLPLPGVSVRLLNEEGQAAADGETGELFLKGPNIFAGYWRRPEATAAAFRDGYFKTGDL